MVDLYVKKILSGDITINDVPSRWRDAVAAKLEEEN